MRMKRENVVYTYNGILFSPKKKKMLQYSMTRLNLEEIMLNEISQSQKGKYCKILDLAPILPGS